MTGARDGGSGGDGSTDTGRWPAAPAGDRPWRVFLSRTRELTQEPRTRSFAAAARAAISQAGHVVVEQEYMTASESPPARTCAELVASCDVYVGLIGFRYGSPVRDDPGRSYTELEFDAATQHRLPRLVMMLSGRPDVALSVEVYADLEHGVEQKRFRARLLEEVTCTEVASPEGVQLKLYQALAELQQQRDAAARARQLDRQPDRERDRAPDRAPDRRPDGAWTRERTGPVYEHPRLLGGEVPRPDLIDAVTGRLARAAASYAEEQAGEAGHEHADSPGPVVALVGGGGFGKTTLARMLVNDPAVRRCFPDGILWATVGHDLTDQDLADKVIRLSRLLRKPQRRQRDPALAAGRLADALGRRRLLLVVDDIWSGDQLDPFLAGGPRTVRLVTTRRPSALPERVSSVPVGVMAPGDAHALLVEGLPLPPEPSPGALPDLLSGPLLGQVLDVTGRWPLLLRLVRGAVAADVRHGARADTRLQEIYDELRAHGPAVLDMADDADRTRAVSVTLSTGLNRLGAGQQARFRELAVFGGDVVGGDVEVPTSVLERYWGHAGGLTKSQVRRLCGTFADLSLLAGYHLTPPPRIVVHDVVRAWLRSSTDAGLGGLHRALVDAHRPLVEGRRGGRSAWWQLPRDQAYFWEWCPHHLHGAGLGEELAATVVHPQWLLGALDAVGPAVLERQLRLAGAGPSVLARVIRQNGHLLVPLDGPGTLAATLASRVPVGQGQDALPDRLRDCAGEGGLIVPAGPMPDLPSPALRRALIGHDRLVTAVAAPVDAPWAVTAAGDGSARIWDVATGACRRVLAGHGGPVRAVTVAPDGGWVATGGDDGTVRIWSVPDDTVSLEVSDQGPIGALAAAPDGSWLAVAGADGKVRIRDVATGSCRRSLGVPTGELTALAASPDGSWLATSSTDGTARIWDVATGACLRTLTGHTGPVRAVTAVAGGTRLATGGADGTARIWDVVTGGCLSVMTGHAGTVTGVAAAADGAWLATGSGDGTARIWDLATGACRSTFAGHVGAVTALCAGERGRWLVTGGWDATARLWSTGPTAHGPAGSAAARPSRPVVALGVAPDGSWLASTRADGTTTICDPETGRPLRTVPGRGEVTTAAIGPCGRWLATGGARGQVHLWDTGTCALRHVLDGQVGPLGAVAAGHRGRWLATAGATGTVWLWDVVTGVCRRVLPLGRPATALAFASDDSWLLAAGALGAVQIWDVATGRRLRTPTGHRGTVTALVVGPDDTWFATGSHDGTARIWEAGSGRCRHVLVGHRGPVTAVAVTPDGTSLVTGGQDGEVRTWEVSSGRCRRTPGGHGGAVSALAVDAGGSHVLTCGEDGTLVVRDLAADTAPKVLRVDGALRAAVWTGGRTMAVGGDHGPYLLRRA